MIKPKVWQALREIEKHSTETSPIGQAAKEIRLALFCAPEQQEVRAAVRKAVEETIPVKLHGVIYDDITDGILAVIPIEKLEKDAHGLDIIRKTCGYVGNGSNQTVTIAEDDATRSWRMQRGKNSYAHADSFLGVIYKFEEEFGDTFE